MIRLDNIFLFFFLHLYFAEHIILIDNYSVNSLLSAIKIFLSKALFIQKESGNSSMLRRITYKTDEQYNNCMIIPNAGKDLVRFIEDIHRCFAIKRFFPIEFEFQQRSREFQFRRTIYCSL